MPIVLTSDILPILLASIYQHYRRPTVPPHRIIHTAHARAGCECSVLSLCMLVQPLESRGAQGTLEDRRVIAVAYFGCVARTKPLVLPRTSYYIVSRRASKPTFVWYVSIPLWEVLRRLRVDCMVVSYICVTDCRIISSGN